MPSTTPSPTPVPTVDLPAPDAAVDAAPAGGGRRLRVGVVGLGYLGAVHAACMADLGHQVVGFDVDARKVEALSAARAPFFEPGLEELLARVTRASERSRAAGGEGLVFTTEVGDLKACEVVFVCVGTPQRKGELAADTTYVHAAVEALAGVVEGPALVVGKSTVPVGTAARLAEVLAERAPGLSLAWNPEFLREGHAVTDTLAPDRLVFGTAPAGSSSRGERDEEVLRAVYARPIAAGTPVLVTDYATAELVKVSANAFLATKISFINAMAEVCEAAGADVALLADAIGLDARIGRRFLSAGVGFGGGCLPKDIRAFMARAGELGADQALTFLREVDAINMRRRSKMVDLARAAVGGSFLGRKVAVLGAAFKPHSDDIRDSPALSVAAMARLQGADVVVTDPAAIPNAQRLWPDLAYTESPAEAITGADVVLLVTEWPQYTDTTLLDPVEMAALARGRSVIDGRNALDARAWRDAGWDYRALGRPRA